MRLRATRPTADHVAIGIGEEPGPARCSLLGGETTLRAPQRSRRWRWRTGLAWVVRPLKPLGAPEACQVRRDPAYEGPLVLRLRGRGRFCSTARVIGTGRLTMAERRLQRQHSWRCVDRDALA